MRRTAPFFASRVRCLTASKSSPTSPGVSAGGLFFADRAVKMTHVAAPGTSFVCTPAVLGCDAPGTAATVRLAADEVGLPVAKVRLVGNCAVSLLRSRRVAFHCAGEEGRVQSHELGLRRGDVLAVLSGCDRLRDRVSVERTLRSVADEDLEYIAEEMLLRLASDARPTALNGIDRNDVAARLVASDESNNSSNGSSTITTVDANGEGDIPSEEGKHGGTCIMTIVQSRPSQQLRQPPPYMRCSMA